MTLFRRLFLTYAAVVGLAVAVLVLAPITVSVPTALAELAVILGGFAVTLVLFHAFLKRALAPLETLTEVMHQIDPLAPGSADRRHRAATKRWWRWRRRSTRCSTGSRASGETAGAARSRPRRPSGGASRGSCTTRSASS